MEEGVDFGFLNMDRRRMPLGAPFNDRQNGNTPLIQVRNPGSSRAVREAAVIGISSLAGGRMTIGAFRSSGAGRAEPRQSNVECRGVARFVEIRRSGRVSQVTVAVPTGGIGSAQRGSCRGCRAEMWDARL